MDSNKNNIYTQKLKHRNAESHVAAGLWRASQHPAGIRKPLRLPVKRCSRGGCSTARRCMAGVAGVYDAGQTQGRGILP